MTFPPRHPISPQRARAIAKADRLRQGETATERLLREAELRRSTGQPRTETRTVRLVPADALTPTERAVASVLRLDRPTSLVEVATGTGRTPAAAGMQLTALIRKGVAERVGPGLYVLAAAVSEREPTADRAEVEPSPPEPPVAEAVTGEPPSRSETVARTFASIRADIDRMERELLDALEEEQAA